MLKSLMVKQFYGTRQNCNSPSFMCFIWNITRGQKNPHKTCCTCLALSHYGPLYLSPKDYFNGLLVLKMHSSCSCKLNSNCSSMCSFCRGCFFVKTSKQLKPVVHTGREGSFGLHSVLKKEKNLNLSILLNPRLSDPVEAERPTGT